jgi:hypothetical protein
MSRRAAEYPLLGITALVCQFDTILLPPAGASITRREGDLMKKLLFILSALSLLATVIPADAGSYPPGKRWYCSGAKCGCV